MYTKDYVQCLILYFKSIHICIATYMLLYHFKFTFKFLHFYLPRASTKHFCHFQVTKYRNFGNYLKILQKFTSFFIPSRAVWCQITSSNLKNLKNAFSTEGNIEIHIMAISKYKNRDFSNFLKIIHNHT